MPLRILLVALPWAALVACTTIGQQPQGAAGPAAVPSTASPTSATGTGVPPRPGTAATRPPQPRPASLPPDLTPGPTAGESVYGRRDLPGGAYVVRGTGQFIDPAAAQASTPDVGPGDVTLNFDNADVRVVAKTILGDILGLSYAVDPKVTGQISLETARPLSREALIPVLESLLDLNDAVLVREAGIYKIMPRGEVITSIMTPRTRLMADQGFQVVVVPLKFIAADDMKKVLVDLNVPPEAVQADARRNLLLVSGSEARLRQILETVELFDVDQFAGMSVGLFRLSYLDAGQMIEELGQIVGPDQDSPLSKMVRFMAIERLNAVMVISSQKQYLDYVRNWIERLDRSDLVAGTRLYVYDVKNREAARLAEVLQRLFPESVGEPEALGVSPVAPGLPVVARELPRVGEEGLIQPEPAVAAIEPVAAGGARMLNADVGTVRFIADEENNALIIMATPEDYARIEGAIRRLDTVPLQVLIEASIVEVILADGLRYGLEWYFKNNNVLDDKTGIGQLDLGDAGIGAIAPGFSYQIVDSLGQVRLVLNALAENALLNVLSSPSLMVLDNREAEIRVGDQVPVRTEAATTEGGVIIESVQFKDTGVLLTVKPRVNVGGLVTMEVSQEVTNVGDVDPATGQRTFLQRKITSTVAVGGGETVVLGGLITENKVIAESGIPVLYKIPLIGKLFGTTENNARRTELLVLITPRVLDDDRDSAQILDEFRLKMRNLNLDTWGGTVQPISLMTPTAPDATRSEGSRGWSEP